MFLWDFVTQPLGSNDFQDKLLFGMMFLQIYRLVIH